MAFTEIDYTYPRGTQSVSRLDDYARETREWIVNSLKKISGYPDLETVKVMTWTTDTRPASATSGILGFNTTTQRLECVYVDADGNISYIDPITTLMTGLDAKLDKVEVANAAGKVPRYNASGQLVLPNGCVLWVE